MPLFTFLHQKSLQGYYRLLNEVKPSTDRRAFSRQSDAGSRSRSRPRLRYLMLVWTKRE